MVTHAWFLVKTCLHASHFYALYEHKKLRFFWNLVCASLRQPKSKWLATPTGRCESPHRKCLFGWRYNKEGMKRLMARAMLLFCCSNKDAWHKNMSVCGSWFPTSLAASVLCLNLPGGLLLTSGWRWRHRPFVRLLGQFYWALCNWEKVCCKSPCSPVAGILQFSDHLAETSRDFCALAVDPIITPPPPSKKTSWMDNVFRFAFVPHITLQQSSAVNWLCLVQPSLTT